MKKLIIRIFVLGLIGFFLGFFSSKACAEELDLSMRQDRLTKTEQIIAGVATVPYALFNQILIHESIHASAAGMLGYKVTSFKPYPHRYDGKFYFGRVGTDAERPLPEQKAFFLLAPSAFNMLAFVTFDILLSTETIKPQTSWEMIAFVMGMIAPAVDFGVGFFKGSDWSKSRNALGRGSLAIDFIGVAALTVMTWRLAWHAKKFILR